MVQDYFKSIDRKFRLPRIWSNRELSRFAKYFKGDVVNVSAWKDSDKEGGRYKDYFCNAASYSITNFKSEARGFQGNSGEIFLDLEGDLPLDLSERFDAVFNHTSLEHIFDVQKALLNLCKMSRKNVVIVVPFLQEMHAEYGDYWRFTPMATKRMFELNGFKQIHCSFNSHKNASVYLFCIATKTPFEWTSVPGLSTELHDPNPAGDTFDNRVGCNAIQNELFNRSLRRRARRRTAINTIKRVLSHLS